MVDVNLELSVTGQNFEYVSRGGVKLACALDHFQIDPAGKICLDIGASTGGFTDVLRQRGAKIVYAVDVGYGLLDWKLQKDDHVVNLQRTNARDLNSSHVPTPVDIIVADVSFISLKKVLLPAITLTRKKASIVALIKPQFEAHRNEVETGGIVTDKLIHSRVCEEITRFLETSGFSISGTIESPIKGPKGNVEFLVYGEKNERTTE